MAVFDRMRAQAVVLVCLLVAVSGMGAADASIERAHVPAGRISLLRGSVL